MDYEQKYKEALEKARQLCAYPTTKPFISDLQDIFPELKESEDRKMIKWLIEAINFVLEDGRVFHNKVIDEAKDAIAWLEKQGKTFTERDIDNAYLKGISDCKHEMDKQQQEPTLDHWQDVRERAVIAAMQGLLAQSGDAYTTLTIATEAVIYADALVEKLKGE